MPPGINYDTVFCPIFFSYLCLFFFPSSLLGGNPPRNLSYHKPPTSFRVLQTTYPTFIRESFFSARLLLFSDCISNFFTASFFPNKNYFCCVFGWFNLLPHGRPSSDQQHLWICCHNYHRPLINRTHDSTPMRSPNACTFWQSSVIYIFSCSHFFCNETRTQEWSDPHISFPIFLNHFFWGRGR